MNLRDTIIAVIVAASLGLGFITFTDLGNDGDQQRIEVRKIKIPPSG